MSTGRQTATKSAPDVEAQGVLILDPNDIEVVDRIGFYHELKAVAFGRLIARDGQRTPISVVRQTKGDKPWRLVAGRHRLEGIKLEGLPFVKAVEEHGNPEDLREYEASENLHRRPLPPIERAMFVQALCESANLKLAREHGDLSQQKLAIKARWARVKAGEVRAEQALQEEADDTADKMSAVYGWQDAAADALGLDKRTVRRALALYRLLVEPFPELAEPLARHPIVGENASQLQLICDVRDESQRRKVIEAVIADPNLEADAARIQVGVDRDAGPAPTKDQKFTNTVVDSWGRLSIPAKRDFLPQFLGLLTPDLKFRLRDMLDGELGRKPAPEAVAPGLTPAVAIRASVRPDYIVCLEDGTRHLNLTMRLNKLGMTPAEYRARWSLPLDYPMVAPNHSQARRLMWRARLATLAKVPA